MKHILTTKRDAYLVYLIISGGSSLAYLLVFTVNMVYQATVVDLNPLQLVLVGTMLEGTVFVCEVPTGVVADVYSRRLSVIIGFFVIGAGFLLEGLAPFFETVLLAQVLWGLGYTFTSGATQAWISDEIGEERAGRAFMRGAQAGKIGGLVAMPISAGLATLRLAVPIVLGGTLFWALGFFLALAMPETGFKRVSHEDRTTWATLFGTLHEGLRLVRRRAILVTVLAVALIQGIHSEGFDRLWTPHLLDNFTFPAWAGLEPVVWFGFISVVSTLLALGGTELARRRLDTSSQTAILRVLTITTTLTAGGIVALALARCFWLALAALWLVQTLRSVEEPIAQAWVNRLVESGVRATMFSVIGQLNAVGQITGGPAIGYLGTVASLRAALTASGLLLSPAALLLVRAQRRERVAASSPVPDAAD